jgi:methylthioribose-1-phosphate isomerase
MREMRTIAWVGDVSGHVRLIDQTLLPQRLEYRDCHSPAEVWEAIKTLRVRGAPAIGIAGAMGVVVGTQGLAETDVPGLRARVNEVCAYLATSRPTAVNLSWALKRMEHVCDSFGGASVGECRRWLLDEALAIEEEDRRCCRAIGAAGAELIHDGMALLTHCNAGGLATADYGTALAVMFQAAERGRRFRVFVDETRPLLQGARLTAWELKERGIEATLICDNAAAHVMGQDKVQLVIVGADRIAANGDTANKIGTYGLALLARAHRIPFYVAAPKSTFDLSIGSGERIPIEERDPREVSQGFGTRTAPEGIGIYNPAFDVTPAELITGIITERGIIRPVNAATIGAVLA